MSSISALPGASGVEPFYQRAMPRALPAGLIDERVYDPALDPAHVAQAAPGDVASEINVTASRSGNPADDEPFSFWDFLDVINPLQHIPGINTLYRELTGDTIKTPIKLIGATVLGGPVGFAAAMADSMIAEATGKDVGQHAMAMLKTDSAAPQAPTTAPVQYAYAPPAKTLAQHAAIAAREFVPDDPALTQAAQTQSQPPPSESQAIIQTAQIAAQANVFPTFKRTGSLGAASEADKAASETKVAAAQAAHASGQGRFMPLRRDGAVQAVGTRREAGATSMSELKARSKFAPGPVNVGGGALSPATLAAVTAAQAPTGESARVSAQTKTTAQAAYAYGRQQSAPNAAPAEVPAWFDQAMLGAIDKYKAMQAVP